MTFANDIHKSIEVLKSGGIILYPTDTIWGLGCDATNGEAVSRIYALKQRAESKSMIVLVEDESSLHYYTNYEPLPPIASYKLSKPLTIIYPMAKNLASNVVAQDGSIAIRVVQDAFCKGLILAFGKPIVSTSANISGAASPRIYEEISEEIKSGAGYIVRHRQNDLTIAKPSAIIQLLPGGETKTIRP